MRLSEAIRKGIPITPEGRTFCGCALGAAWNAEMGYILNGSNLWDLLKNHKNKDFPYDEIFVAFSEKTGWDMGLIENISKKHFVGEMSREQCADYAEQWEREHGLIGESPAQFASRMVEQIKGMAKANPVEA